MGNCGSAEKKKKDGTNDGPITFKYHTDTSALEYYEPVQVLAEGSISTIHLVRRRKERLDVSYAERADIDSLLVSPLETDENGNNFANEKNTPYSGQIYVLKSIMKSYVKNDVYLDEMRSEINMMKHLDHPNVAKVYEGYERKRHVHLIMEYCSGGNLTDRFPYTEREAANIIRQILSAVAYLHKKNIVHRDIKLENVVFESKLSNAVKIIDFGLATKYLSNDYKKLSDKVGTLYTMAPQQIQGMYTEACDLWSIGVVAFCLLSGGDMPFYGSTRKVVIDKIMRCNYDFKGSGWKYVSDEAKEFVSSLLVMDPKKRPSADLALKSKWMKKVLPPVGRKLEKSEAKKVCNSLFCYSQEKTLKKIALLLIAHKTSSRDIDELTELFLSTDKNGDGLISLQEFCKLLLDMNMTREEMKDLFSELDVEKNGVVRYTEFIAAMLEAQGRIDRERIAEAFEILDSDHSGEITRDNIRDLLAQRGNAVSETRLDSIFKELETEKCCVVTKKEFLDLFEEKKIDYIKRISCPCADTDDDDESDLVGPHAIIPGGKYTIDDLENNESRHIYDKKTDSMMRCDIFERAQDSACCN